MSAIIEELVAELRLANNPVVIMPVGVPGSGKTTLMTQLANEMTFQRISPDKIRRELTGSMADQSANRAVWQVAEQRAKDSLSSNKSVIIDATHADAKQRIAAIQKYRSFGAQTVYAIVLDVPLAVSLERNRQRKRRVPESAIRRMYKNLKHQRVSTEEGFDRVIQVSL